MGLAAGNLFDQDVVVAKLWHLNDAIVRIVEHEPELAKFRLTHNEHSSKRLFIFFAFLESFDFTFECLVSGNIVLYP